MPIIFFLTYVWPNPHLYPPEITVNAVVTFPYCSNLSILVTRRPASWTAASLIPHDLISLLIRVCSIGSVLQIRNPLIEATQDQPRTIYGPWHPYPLASPSCVPAYLWADYEIEWNTMLMQIPHSYFVIIRERTTSSLSSSVCWQFCNSPPSVAQRRPSRRLTRRRNHPVLPGAEDRRARVVQLCLHLVTSRGSRPPRMPSLPEWRQRGNHCRRRRPHHRGLRLRTFHTFSSLQSHRKQSLSHPFNQTRKHGFYKLLYSYFSLFIYDNILSNSHTMVYINTFIVNHTNI